MLLVRQERFCRFTRLMQTLVGALTVGTALIVASAFMQAADAQQFRQPRPDDKVRLRMIRECMEMNGKSGNPGQCQAGGEAPAAD